MDFAYRHILPADYHDMVKYIGQENIFKLIFEDVSFDKKYVSPFRADKNPGAFFKISQNDNLQFVDYGDPITKYYGWADAIRSYYNIDSFHGAVDFVRRKFETGEGKDFNPLKLSEEESLEVKQEVSSVVKPIQIVVRDWDLRDKVYWSKYGISKQQLIDDRVVPLELFSVMSRSGLWFSRRPFSITYGYLFPEEKIKIYSPEAVNPGDKWFTNCLPSDIGNWDNIDWEAKHLVITKSYKDCRVLRNLGYNSVWVQSENQIPPIEKLVQMLKFEALFIFYDNDETGIKSADSLNTLFASLKENVSKSIHIPLEYKVKDISDFYEKYGKSETKKILNRLLKF